MSAQSGVPASRSPIDSHSSPVADRGRGRGDATASLVLGIIALLVGVLVTSLIGWILAAFAIVFGLKSRRGARRHGAAADGRATAGIVLGIVTVVLGVVVVIVAVTVL